MDKAVCQNCGQSHMLPVRRVHQCVRCRSRDIMVIEEDMRAVVIVKEWNEWKPYKSFLTGARRIRIANDWYVEGEPCVRRLTFN